MVGPKERLSRRNLRADQITPDVQFNRSKAVKNLQPIVCTGILVLAMSAPAVAKPGTISTTAAGTISTTRTGTISTTRTGTISTTAVGTISTTRTGIISTTSTRSTVSSDRFSLIELLLSVFAPW